MLSIAQPGIGIGALSQLPSPYVHPPPKTTTIPPAQMRTTNINIANERENENFNAMASHISFLGKRYHANNLAKTHCHSIYQQMHNLDA